MSDSTTFVTVDRRGLCAPGRTLNLLGPRDMAALRNLGTGGVELADTIECLDSNSDTFDTYPLGLSPHGIFYLHARAHPEDTTIPADAKNNAQIEEAIELVRMTVAPPRPVSRYESMFAWESIDNIDGEALSESQAKPYPVYEVSADSHLKADWSLLTLSGAVRYWAGDAGPNPVWEVVLPMPVRVGRLVGHLDQGVYHPLLK